MLEELLLLTAPFGGECDVFVSRKTLLERRIEVRCVPNLQLHTFLMHLLSPSEQFNIPLLPSHPLGADPPL